MAYKQKSVHPKKIPVLSKTVSLNGWCDNNSDDAEVASKNLGDKRR